MLGALPTQRPGLGIRLAEDAWTRALGLKGVLILDVVPGGTGEHAGLRPTRPNASGALELGHVILAVDDVPVNSKNDFVRELAGHRMGDRVSVWLRRDGQVTSASVVVAFESH
ncbi:MAG: PDZ domain-containing protein [Planctomycetes bacterium]|nr:PDZ domain-containing protein [Planctomycetota bacterium]